MKKLLLGLILSIILVPSLAMAVDIGTGSMNKIAAGAGYGAANEFTVSETIGRYIKVALSLIGTIFIVLIVYAGFLWMTASGNEDSVSKSKDIIKMAMIGLFITLGAYSITAFVIAKVGGSVQGKPATTGGTAGGTGCDGGFSCWWNGAVNQANQYPAGQPN